MSARRDLSADFVSMTYEGSLWPAPWREGTREAIATRDFERVALSCFLRDWPEPEARWRLEQALGRAVGRLSA